MSVFLVIVMVFVDKRFTDGSVIAQDLDFRLRLLTKFGKFDFTQVSTNKTIFQVFTESLNEYETVTDTQTVSQV